MLKHARSSLMLPADSCFWRLPLCRRPKRTMSCCKVLPSGLRSIAKRMLRSRVVNEQGEPIPGAKLAIEQTRHAFLFGCNFFAFGKQPNDRDEQAYRTQFAELFNFATIGFYWPSYERRQGAPNHAYAETVARWCREHGITPKGHPLAWNFSDPRWLPDDSDEVRRLQLERIDDCVTRMRGLIDVWDVVNEATHFERDEFKRRAPKLTKMWEETGRMEFVDQCFQTARKAGPDATLLINDYRTDPAYAKLMDQMARTDEKKAYDVIGIQSHMHGGVWDNRKIWEVCQRFARFDVPLHFTELTVVSGAAGWERARPWDSTPEGEERQAEEVQRIYTMLFLPSLGCRHYLVGLCRPQCLARCASRSDWQGSAAQAGL